MGLPVTKKQVEQLFRQFDEAGTGSLDMVSFTRDLMGMGGQKAATPKPPKTASRGGSPCMPKEFRVPTARPKTQCSALDSVPEHPAALRSHRSNASWRRSASAADIN